LIVKVKCIVIFFGVVCFCCTKFIYIKYYSSTQWANLSFSIWDL